jgi:hypothetical protein
VKTGKLSRQGRVGLSCAQTRTADERSLPSFLIPVLPTNRLLKGTDEDRAASVWRSCGVELKQFASELSGMQPDEVKADAEKHGLAFLVA